MTKRNQPRSTARKGRAICAQAGDLTLSPEAKLGARVKIIGECWVVDGKVDSYAQVSVGGKQMPAHRWIYMNMVGVVEDDEHVHHTCLHPGCIRPDHLMALSPGDHSRIHAELRRAS